MAVVAWVALMMAAADLPPVGGSLDAEPMPAAAQHGGGVADTPEPLPTAAEAAPESDVWAGENRRVHFSVGAVLHGGIMDSGGYALWVLQSELIGIVSIRLKAHDELRVQLGLSGGWPDSFGGETNVTYQHALSPRLSIGIGGFAYLGIWSCRIGAEVPFIIRIGSSRRHQLIFALRLHTGVFDNVPLSEWTLRQQRLAVAGDAVLGYAFQF